MLCLFFLLIIIKEKEFDFMKIGKVNISKKSLFIICVILFTIIISIVLFSRGASKASGMFYNPDKNIKIVRSKASKIEFEDFNNGDVTLKKPKGWKVDTLGDYIHYTIKVYDPNNPTYQFFLNMKTEGYNKSEDAKKWQ